MNKNLTLDMFLPAFLEASKRAAIACHHWIGRGDKIAADDAATTAMRNVLKNHYLNCKVVIGEGEMDGAPMLYIGEKFCSNEDLLCLDVAVDPLEGTNLCAKAMPGAMTVIAFAEQGGILNCPDIYMDKLVVTPGFFDAVDLDFPLERNLLNLANAKECKISDLKIIILERDRHQEIIKKARLLGAKVVLISDGDIAAVLSVLLGFNDMYIGSGGAPEGVLSAIAVKSFKGEMHSRLIFNTEEEKIRAKEFGITDLNKKYCVSDLIKKEGYFIASGVTKGDILEGVSEESGLYEVSSLILSTKHHEMQMINSSIVA